MRVDLRSLVVYSVLLILITGTSYAQVVPSDTSEQQMFDYYQQIKTQGYSDEQIKALAELKGLSAEKIATFEDRLLNADKVTEENGTLENTLELEEDQVDSNTNDKTNVDSDIFGMDFFSNTNISFTPNLNLSTPINYKLGPGDNLVISVWGAAERTYNLSVDREGALRIPNIGPLLVNGLTIEEATSKIKGALKRIYNGLDAPENSPYRVNLGVSLASVRTVQINIIGEVNTPGTYSLSSLSTVLNALYAAGGPTNKGTFRDIKLVRNGQENVTFDMYKYLTEGSQEGNIVLRDQDVIIVSPYISRIDISGAVKRPGLFELKNNETLNDLLKFTSGFTSMAYQDMVIVERIEGDGRRVIEVDMNKATSEILKNGDVINVQTIMGGFENKVEIEGAVARPGVFELTEGLTVSQLIKKADDVLPKAFLERGVILRVIDGVESEIISFSISDILNGTAEDVILKNNDLIKIYNKHNLKETSYITISGAVIEPKKIRFVDNLSVEDMVLLAGGFTENADITKIDIYRKIYGEKEDRLIETLRIGSLGIDKKSASTFVLKPNDRISVRYLKGYTAQIAVSVKGEINYPGSYSLETREEKISDLINKAGGLSKYAYAEGASLTRINPYYNVNAQKEVVEDVKTNISEEDENITLKNQKTLRVGIDLKKIIENPDSKYNMVLKSGDVINIPSTKQTVKVEGEVLVPSLIRFDKSYELKDYISNSGGFAENARKGKTYVVYLNGEIASTKRFLFFKNYPKLEPGALVIVPNKPSDKRKLSAQEIIGLTTSVATLALLAKSFL